MAEKMLAQPLEFRVDMRGGLMEQPQRAKLMRGDKNATRVSVMLYDGEKEYEAAGLTVTGKYTRSDNVDIQLAGEASGNRASVLLDEHCYAVAGRYELRVRLTQGDVTRTILYISGQVENDGEGGILDVENVIPSIDDIVAQYAEMKRVTQETQAARDEAIRAAMQASFEILDRYDTYAQMTDAHPTGEAGMAFAVGSVNDNEVYIWGIDTMAWVSIGKIMGPQGAQGPEGPEGFSPTVEVEEIEGGHRVTITYKGGQHVFDVMDGKDGAQYDQDLNKADAVTFASVTADVVYGAVFME